MHHCERLFNTRTTEMRGNAHTVPPMKLRHYHKPRHEREREKKSTEKSVTRDPKPFINMHRSGNALAERTHAWTRIKPWHQMTNVPVVQVYAKKHEGVGMVSVSV